MIAYTINGGGAATIRRLARSMKPVIESGDVDHWRILVQGKSGGHLETLRLIKSWFKDRVTISLYPQPLPVPVAWNENLAWHEGKTGRLGDNETRRGERFVNIDDDIEIMDPAAVAFLNEGLDGPNVISCANREAIFPDDIRGKPDAIPSQVVVVDHATAFAAYRPEAALHPHNWKLVQYGHDSEWHMRLCVHLGGMLTVDWRDTVSHYNQTGTAENFDQEKWSHWMKRDEEYRRVYCDPHDNIAPPFIWHRLPGYVWDIEEN